VARIDLRSDTVTKPSPAMRRAMAEAEVGDDVFGDDPTVNALEERAAELLGKEAGLFVASGTMGNLVAQMAHLARGQETIAGREHHIVIDEAAGHAVIVGSSIRALDDRSDGTMDPAAIDAAFRRRLGSLLLRVTILLAAVASIILVYTYATAVIIALIVGLAAFTLVDNVREVSRR